MLPSARGLSDHPQGNTHLGMYPSSNNKIVKDVTMTNEIQKHVKNNAMYVSQILKVLNNVPVQKAFRSCRAWRTWPISFQTSLPQGDKIRTIYNKHCSLFI